MVLFVFLTLFSQLVYAQADNPSGLTFVDENTAPVELESTRYIKKATRIKNPSNEPAKGETRKTKVSKRKPAQSAEAAEPGNQIVEIKVGPPAADPRNGSEQFRNFIFGGDTQEIENYKNHLDSDDIRKNILDLKVGLSHLYNSSASPYYFRNYLTSSPGAFVGVDVWVSPFFGFNIDYRFSMLSEVKEAPQSESFLKVAQQWYNGGIKLRRFFGFSTNHASLTFALGYAHHEFRSSAESLYRMRHSTKA